MGRVDARSRLGLPRFLKNCVGARHLRAERRGAHVTVGRRGVTRTVGIPGTGVFYTSRSGRQSGLHNATPPTDVQPASDAGMLAAVIVIGIVLVALALLTRG